MSIVKGVETINNAEKSLGQPANGYQSIKAGNGPRMQNGGETGGWSEKGELGAALGALG